LHVKRLSSRLSNALSEACGREGSVFVLLDADAATGDLAELVGQALDGLCRDDLGRQAVAAAIQQVEITATASAASVTLAQGTLKVQGAHRLADLVERLESLL
jgi:hypothetical protein